MHKTMDQKRPPIPRDLYRPSLLGALCFATYSVGLWLGPAALAIWVARSDVDLAWKILLIAPLMLLAQQGMHLLAWVGHEGMHFTLHKNKYISALTGTVFSSMIPAFVNIGATFSHWQHHRYTNQPSDPHCDMFPRFKSFWSRLILARPYANRRFFREAVRVSRNEPLEYPLRLPFSPRQIRALTIFNLALIAFFLVLYAAITVRDPMVGLLLVWIPFALGILHSGLRIFVEHAGTEAGKFRDSRTYSSPLLTAAYFGNNYHLEHHLYPSVPCYKLPALHRWLEENGHLENSRDLIDSRVHTYWLPTAPSSAYPTAEGAQDSSELDNPYLVAATDG